MRGVPVWVSALGGGGENRGEDDSGNEGTDPGDSGGPLEVTIGA